MKPKWTRKRWFVGVEKGTYKKTVFSCLYTPTAATHELWYGYTIGPYKTKKEANRQLSFSSN